MLPTHSHGSYGARRARDAKVAGAAAAVLGVALLLSSWSWLSARSQHVFLQRDLTELKSQLTSHQQRRFEELSKRRNVETQHHNLNRELQHAIHSLHRLDQELVGERHERDLAEEDCRKKLEEGQDRLAYEQSVNGALKKHLETVETAHSTRERDWHVLADKWKDYETKAIAENQRLLIEQARLQNNEIPREFKAPDLPFEEPRDRPETHFDASFHKPEFQAQKHEHPPLKHDANMHLMHADHEEHLDPIDRYWSQEGNDHYEVHKFHDQWRDSHGVEHNSWEDPHGVLHDSWKDAHGVTHDNWVDEKGIEHNEWMDQKGYHHDDWLDQHGIHHDQWKGPPRHQWQGQGHEQLPEQHWGTNQHMDAHWDAAHNQHHDQHWDPNQHHDQHWDPNQHHDQHWDPNQHHDQHWDANQHQDQHWDANQHHDQHWDAGHIQHHDPAWDQQHQQAHDPHFDAQKGHGGAHHAVPSWHSGSHDHGAAAHHDDGHGKAPWRH